MRILHFFLDGGLMEEGWIEVKNINVLLNLLNVGDARLDAEVFAVSYNVLVKSMGLAKHHRCYLINHVKTDQ